MTATLLAIDAPRWRELVAAHGDVYHHTAYLAACAGGDEAVVAVIEDGDAWLAVPLVLRPLPGGGLGDGWRDAESPYGYASPLAHGDVAPLWPRFAALLADERIVNAFLRFHPLERCALPPSGQLGADHQTAWIPLADGRDQAFTGSICAMHRQAAKRALKQGYRAEVVTAPRPGALGVFRAIYGETMDRLAAGDAYRHGDAYYEALCGLGDRLAVITVLDGDGAAMSAALFLRGARWAHYHLSGRRSGCPDAAGHLVFEAAADWAAAGACHGVHLGGGLSARDDDPLLFYKRHVGRAGAAFRIAGVIGDAQQHAALVARWQAESGRSATWFQAYRAPASVTAVSP